ncbi:MAG: hypothetical protein MR301_06240 [Prevotella sp.]|nr:hypothetical protein [Prevotella sp.]MDD7046955.1 hypothetical protein [Prevotella sp.]MDY5545733.1 hypothetical protein [Prevotella sp.]
MARKEREINACDYGFGSSRLGGNDEYRRTMLVHNIEHAVERMTLKELEALSYDMFTKGYMDYPDL